MIATWSKGFVSGAILLTLVLLYLSGCEMVGSAETTTPTGSDRKIVVASHIVYPPFEFFSEGEPRGEPRGFDIELMNEIAERMGLEVEYTDVPFDTITQGLTVEHFDAAISAMTITEIRKGQAEFSEPYYEVSEALVVRSTSEIESTEDLAGGSIGAQPGVAEEPAVGEFMASAGVAQRRTLPTAREAFDALRDGTVDGVIHTLPASQEVVENSGGELEIVEVIPTGEHYGIAFPKDSALVDPVNEALSEIKSDGTYEEIYERWIGRPPEEIP
jgi:ABC-type amino acid transport substrate-binding protein